MASLELAWKEDTDAVEVDIHLSKDNQIVVIHDYNANRTGGLNKNIKDLELSELKKLDFGSWKGPDWSGERIALLSDVLESVPYGKQLFIEVKSEYEIIEPLSKQLTHSTVPLSNIIIMHFDFNTLLKIKDNFPETEILWLYEFLPDADSNQRRELLNNIVSKASEHKLHGVSIENIPEFDIEFINICRAKKLKTYCWVVNDPARAQYLSDSGIDGITTDRPGWLKNRLHNLSD